MADTETTVEPVVAVEPALDEVDHHAELKRLATELKGASPSRIETIQAEMFAHLEAETAKEAAKGVT
jgi:hypothetical protein